MLEKKFDSLLDCRKEIDTIDEKVVELLEYRMKISKQVGEIKKRDNIIVLDSSREEEILDRIRDNVKSDDIKDVICDVYKCIMSKSKELQKY